MSSHPLPFSATARTSHRDALGRQTFDLLVIGGGVTGAGIARDAADRGLRVALVEAGDWAQGTSSRSSRLIHGGLRYLEQLEFGLVFEASAERRRLLELAPHLVHPLPFLFPVYKNDGVSYRVLQAGMWLYDALALFRNIGRHRMLDRKEALKAEPRLKREGLRGGAIYYDARVDDARLGLATARGAHESGAATVSYAEVVEFVKEEGMLRGAVVRDHLGGETVDVRARVVINATGPWSDAIRTLADPGATPRLRATKGVHIVLHRERVGNNSAITFESPVDGRVMFVLPWERFTYIGTTDTDYEGSPADAAANRSDVEYLLASVNALFPDAALEPADVLSTWAGLRPLLAPASERGGVSAGQTSREHEIWRDPNGLLNIAGGKLTTFRIMAAEATDEAATILRDEYGVESRASRTGRLPLPGATSGAWEPFLDRVQAQADTLGLSPETASHLARAYGTGANDVLGAIRHEAELGAPLLSGLPPVRAEIGHAVRHEMAVTLEDLLQRRLSVIYQAEDGGLGIARSAAEEMARQPELGWDKNEIERQLECYAATVQQIRQFRSPPPGR